MSDVAISVKNLGKKYRIGALMKRNDTLRDQIVDWSNRMVHRFQRKQSEKQEESILWALKDISFDVKKGQVLGVIGKNGAGKSTLLKVLSRITEPSAGEVVINGRVGSLLEVGTGFHPELTGRENIYLNGAILGMTRSEINRKFDAIVEFSEVGRFIDTPVKRFSSGMYLRLAFAVAAFMEPEILVVDEVLAVGDAEFQQKCLGKMSEVANEGRTVLFVSHNMSAILRLTQEAIVLNKGQLQLRAPTPEAVDLYLSGGHAKAGEHIWQAEEIPADAAPFLPEVMRLMDIRGNIVDTIRSTEPSFLEVEYTLKTQVTGLRIGFYLHTARGEAVLTSFDTDKVELFEKHTRRKAGRYISRCTIPADLLNQGRYTVSFNASSYNVRRYFRDEQVLDFTVDATGAPGMQWSEPRPGIIRPRLEWEIMER
ncbi:MAG: ABC transporter ATP-binding protein [Anaerolineales bacterium]|jgi:lipopolysaccharide transport system ATP-binding protein